MITKLIAKIHTPSLLLGTVLTLTLAALLGADEADESPAEVLPLRYLVLESSPAREPANGYHFHLLKVSPHYGKIDSDSLKFRLASETQEITMIVTTGEDYQIRRGDIIGFESFQHLLLSPGSQVIRHLPTGGHELVP